MIKQNIIKTISFTGYGFASGLPYVLIFITLTAWLRDVGLDLSIIGFFSWIMLTYSLKFLWAPLIDKYPTKLFKRFGHRRSWIITMQLQIIISLIVISLINPLTNLVIFALFAFIIALAGSIQDIAIDAYRIESAKLEDQGNLAAGYQFGYRIAILIGSSFALIFAENFSWAFAYQLMAILMGINIFLSIYISSEKPNNNLVKLNYQNSFIEPVKDFFDRFGIKIALILLLIIATYRLTDIVMGPMANPFYIDMGYSLSEIGYVVKVIALVGTIIGVFAGGVLIKKMGLYKSLLIGAILVMFTNLFYSEAPWLLHLFFVGWKDVENIKPASPFAQKLLPLKIVTVDFEAANGPVTGDAANKLWDKKIGIIPDILTNAGGVTVSYFEWVQNLQQFKWTEDEVNSKLEKKMVNAFEEVYTIKKEKNIPMRIASFMAAIDRVSNAYNLREG